jgi:hypothetical protein
MMLTAVLVACVPTLYHIFAGLNSGLTTTQIPDGNGHELPQTKASGSVNQSYSGTGQSHLRSRSRERSSKNGRSMFDGWGGGTGVVTRVSCREPNQNDEGDRKSNSSEGTESTRHLTQGLQGRGTVLRTVDITVEVEHHRDRL